MSPPTPSVLLVKPLYLAFLRGNVVLAIALGIEKPVERSALQGAVAAGADLGIDAHGHAGVAVADLLHDVGAE